MARTSSSIVTPQMIREYIWDRTLADNELEMKLRFTDDEIVSAMESAARRFNSIPPVHIKVTSTALPADTNMFVDGTVVALYIARVSRLEANDIDHTSGGVEVNLEKRQIEYMTKRIDFHRELFEKAASDVKVAINVSSGFGRVG